MSCTAATLSCRSEPLGVLNSHAEYPDELVAFSHKLLQPSVVRRLCVVQQAHQALRIGVNMSGELSVV
jgi:hypothetical protein